MAMDTVASLVDTVRQLRLLDAAQLDELTRTLQPRFPEPRALARELVQRAWLTPYQVNQLLQGRGADLVLGSYLLIERLGEGGMGHVYKARHRGLGKIVALKVIRKDRLTNTEAVKRFHREIQAVAQLSHANVVMAYDADTANGLHFFAMEYVEGTDLGKWVKDRGPLPVEQACDFIRQAALGLQHAFEKGLIHRDIKPGNLIVTSGTSKNGRGGEAQTVKLMDLGLARLQGEMEEAMTALTVEGAVVGTPDFIAPEQARNARAADIRADLYSLGCTFYFLLTGQTPFVGGTLTEKLLKHHWDSATPVETLRSGVSPAVGAIIRKLMAKKPDDRYQTPNALAEALAAVKSGAPAGAQSVSPTLPVPVQGPALLPQAHIATPVGITTQVNGTGPTRWQRLRADRKRFKYVVGGGAGLLTLLLFTIVLLARSGGKGAGDTRAQARTTTPAGPDVRPIDLLRRDGVPAVELTVAGNGEPRQAPGNVVGILGDSRLKHWNDVTGVAYLMPGGGGGSGALVASSSMDGTIRIWSGVTGQHIRTIAGHQGPVLGVGFSSDGKHVISVGGLERDRSARVWDLTSGKEVHGVGVGASSGQFSISGNGRRLAAANGREILLWDMTNAAPLGRLRNLPFRPGVTAFSRDGSVLAAGYGDGTVDVFDVGDEKRIRTVNALQSPVHSLAVSADGKTVAAGTFRDGTIKLFDSTPGRDPRTLKLEGAAGTQNLAFSADGKTLAVASTNWPIRLYDISGETPKDLKLLPGHAGQVSSMVFTPSGRQLVTGSRGAGSLGEASVKIWETDTGREQSSSQAAPGGRVVAISPDGRYVVWGGRGRTLHVWDVVDRREVRTLPLTSQVVYDLAYSPDGKYLGAALYDGTVRLWEMPAGKELTPLRVPESGPAIALAFGPDSKTLAVVTGDHSIRLWDAPQAREINKLARVTEFAIYTLAFSSDGKTVAIGANEDSVQVWDTTKPAARSLPGPLRPVQGLAFTPDGKSLAAGGWDGSIRLWDLAQGGEARIFKLTRSSPILSIGFSPDGKTMAASTAHGTLALFEVRNAAAAPSTLTLGPDHGLIPQIAFAPEGRHIITANGNGTVYFVRLPERR